ncbi:MAG TPA: hypothetical protein VLM75_06665 [Spirochaetota bacterium]|nr:hypothetical protein [Spirochaetota bacterium]
MEIKLYHIDTLEYSGCIVARDAFDYEFRDVADAHFIATTRGMPLRALLANLITFDLVYDVADEGACAE